MTRTRSDSIFDRLVTWSLDRPLSPTRQMLLAAGTVTLVGLVRALFITDLLPWLLFVPVILVVTLVTSSAAGLLATGLAACLAVVSLADSQLRFWLLPGQWLAAGLFVLVMAGLVAMATELRLGLGRGRALNAALAQREQTLAEREAFLSSVLAASTDCIKVLELDGTLSFMSEGGMRTMELSDFNTVRGCPWPDLLQRRGAVLAGEAIEAARRGETSHFDTDADTVLGTPKYWSMSVSPIRDETGAVSRILSVSRDHTSLHEARVRQQLLNGELGHRLKNMLAMVQSIAYQTLRNAGSLPEASAAFSSRLASLGEATDILTATAWQNAELHAVVGAGLTSVAGMDGRVTIEGPRLMIEAQAALGLTLALHELATNAVKYGALGGGAGTVSIRWSVDGQGSSPRFLFTWTEAGGPAVQPPTRKGFGSRMIERSLGGYFRGTTTLAYPVEGAIFRIDAQCAGVVETMEA